MRQFGPYQVQGVIARGGMGAILRAYDTRHDRVVALKVLAENLAADHDFRERFKREAHAAARLREPHVIPIHSYGEIEGQLYLDMRLVEGSDVGALIASGGPMRPADAVDIVEQVAQALDAAHAEGLVHRDVKPSNVLISNGGFAYLVDFGIAHSARSSTTLTTTGAAIGTLDYMAPERFGDGQVDARSDVYSLACMLYQSLTGAKPFSGTTVESLINAHLNYQPPVPSAAFGHLSRELDQVILRGMAKDPAARFASAGELARAARQAVSSATAIVPDKKRRNAVRWGLVGAGVVLVAAVAAVVAVALPSGGSGPRPLPPQAGQPGSPQPAPVENPASTPGSPTSQGPSESEPEPGKPATPVSRVCKSVASEGKERGTGCFEAAGDHFYVHDTTRDGKWIRLDWETDYGRSGECRDGSSEGGQVDCRINLKETGRVRFQVELRDSKKLVTSTGWTDKLPIGQ